MATDLTPGARVGRFVVGKHLGEGGMGTVVEARDPELGRSVALKLLRAEGGDTMRLLREAQALATISHPNVVAVYELGTHDGEVFLAMELVDGVSLDHYLAERRRPWSEVLALFVQAGRGLAAVHERGMVHRDVKPANVLVDRNGRVRVGDFGLARRDTGPVAGARTSAPASENDRANREATPANVTVTQGESLPVERGAAMLGTPLTRTGAVLGTPRYMAPEQHAGARATHKADQFSFCVALWEALFGAHPFDHASGAELSAAVHAGRVLSPAENRGVPSWLEKALLRGLRAEPTERWPNMTTLLVALERRPRSWYRRPITFAVLAIAAIAAALYPFAGQKGTTKPDPCPATAARISEHWNPTILASAWRRVADTPDGLDDIAAFSSFSMRWSAMRLDACHEGTRPWAMACLDQALDGFDRAVSAEPWHTKDWGQIQPDLPSLDACAGAQPKPAPRMRTVGGRREETRMTLSSEGDIVLFLRDRARIISATGERDVALPESIREGSFVGWSPPHGLMYVTGTRLDVIDIATGVVSSRTVPEHTWAVTPDLERGLVSEYRRWSIVSLDSGKLSPITQPELKDFGNVQWSPDRRRIAAIAVGDRGPSLEISLRIIDADTLSARDHRIRLEHELIGGIALQWIDNDRVAMNGRADPDRGEGIWVATVDRAGELVAWEQRLDAPSGIGYGALGRREGQVLVRVDTVSTRVVRLGDAGEHIVSDSVVLSYDGGLSIMPDGASLIATSARGPVRISIEHGTSMLLPVRTRGSIGVRNDGRILTTSPGRVVAVGTDGGEQTLLTVEGDPYVSCNALGDVCLLVWNTNDGATGRTLSADGNLGPRFALPRSLSSLAVSPDGSHVAAMELSDFVTVIEVATGHTERWPIKTDNCARVGLLAWGTALVISLGCRGAGPRTNTVFEMTRDGPGRILHTGTTGHLGSLAFAPDGHLYAIVRRIESQPAIVEGL